MPLPLQRERPCAGDGNGTHARRRHAERRDGRLRVACTAEEPRAQASTRDGVRSIGLISLAKAKHAIHPCLGDLTPCSREPYGLRCTPRRPTGPGRATPSGSLPASNRLSSFGYRYVQAETGGARVCFVCALCVVWQIGNVEAVGAIARITLQSSAIGAYVTLTTKAHGRFSDNAFWMLPNERTDSTLHPRRAANSHPACNVQHATCNGQPVTNLQPSHARPPTRLSTVCAFLACQIRCSSKWSSSFRSVHSTWARSVRP